MPQPFDDAEVVDWTLVWSLLTGEQRLLPTTMLYYYSRAEQRPACVGADSNGNAAGTSLKDAIVRGFLKLVERDAIALWWYNRTRQPGVALDSFEDPWLAGLPGMYRRLGREVWVLDVTSDLGIPVMAAISRRTGDTTQDIMYGFGAHFDPRIALRRALTELGQLLPPAAGSRGRRDGYGAGHPHLESWWTDATMASQPYLAPQPGRPPRDAADYGWPAPGYPDLDGICAVTRRAGLDILVLDQTRPDIKMAGETTPPEPVVKPQADEYLELHRPRWEELREEDPPLTVAIEGRRSVRRHDARPVTVTELGDLLYRTARVRSLITVEQEDYRSRAALRPGTSSAIARTRAAGRVTSLSSTPRPVTARA